MNLLVIPFIIHRSVIYVYRCRHRTLKYCFSDSIPYSFPQVYWKMVYGILTGKEEYKTTYTQDGGMFSRVKWTSGLIEGKGRYLNNQTG